MKHLFEKHKAWQIVKDDLTELQKIFDERHLTEDLLQMEYGEFIVDAGWYDRVKSFMVFLIKNFDWEEPIAKIYASSLPECYLAIEFCLSFGEELIARTKPTNN